MSGHLRVGFLNELGRYKRAEPGVDADPANDAAFNVLNGTVLASSPDNL